MPPKAAPPTFEARCASCNYGVVVRIAPERCPLCGKSTWEHVRASARAAA